MKKKVYNKKIILLTVFIILLGFYQVYSLNVEEKDPYQTVLKDNCGKTLNNVVMHTIEDNSRCSVSCRNTCRSLELEYDYHEFEPRLGECHYCFCSCK